ATAALAVAGGPFYARGIDFVEQDLRDKLKRLRINARNLRAYLVAWSIAVVALPLGFWIGLNPLVFGGLFAIMLVCVPAYAIPRMAETRRFKIEDQLADAMVSLASAIK